MRSSSIRPWALLIATACLVAACAGTGFVYRNADWFLSQWAKIYFKLDGQQLRSWEPELQAALRDHRRNEVPRLMGLMEGFAAGARVGFDEARSGCLGTGLWEVYSRHAGYGAELLTPLLGRLSTEQVDKLAAKFANEDEESPKTGPERRLRKRAKRLASAAEWLVGPLTKEQQALVQKVNGAIPDTGPAWREHQQDQQRLLLALLREKAGPERLQAQLLDWWVDFADSDPSLRKAQDALVAGMGELIEGIGGSLTPEQKGHLLGQLGDLRKDLVGDNAKIEAIPLTCAPALVEGTPALAPPLGGG